MGVLKDIIAAVFLVVMVNVVLIGLFGDWSDWTALREHRIETTLSS